MEVEENSLFLSRNFSTGMEKLEEITALIF